MCCLQSLSEQREVAAHISNEQEEEVVVLFNIVQRQGKVLIS
ncbi:hypothetical protein Hdeb2414_s0468g00900441 [Helianthus debilis subsp. tardiflorus]